MVDVKSTKFTPCERVNLKKNTITVSKFAKTTHAPGLFFYSVVKNPRSVLLLQCVCHGKFFIFHGNRRYTRQLIP